MIEFKLNGQRVEVDAEPDKPLLWVLRENLGLTGTKYSCGEGVCGACTVHVDGETARACIIPISNIAGREVTTIEGLASQEPMHPVLKAWLEERVPQCGYCQPAQIMTATAMLQAIPEPTDQDIDELMSGVLCRCGTYPRIRKAIHKAAELAKGSEDNE